MSAALCPLCQGGGENPLTKRLVSGKLVAGE